MIGCCFSSLFWNNKKSKMAKEQKTIFCFSQRELMTVMGCQSQDGHLCISRQIRGVPLRYCINFVNWHIQTEGPWHIRKENGEGKKWSVLTCQTLKVQAENQL